MTGSHVVPRDTLRAVPYVGIGIVNYATNQVFFQNNSISYSYGGD